MSYVIGSTNRQVHFYVFDFSSKSAAYRLEPHLDLHKVSSFGDKQSARQAAIRAGLKTWRYVKI